MPKLAILHYLPLEYYPPVTNLIDYITHERSKDLKVKVFSCRNVKGREGYRVQGIGNRRKDIGYRSKDIGDKDLENRDKGIGNRSGDPKTNNLIPKILRSPFPKETDNSIIRLLKYLHYNLFTLLNLLIYRPNALLYYESYSAWPAYIYSKFFNQKCRIFIHHHEYASKEWYSKTMKQVQYFHQLEKKWLYPRATWNSQTNEDRLQFFHQDHPGLKKEQLRILPNYPPSKWKVESLKFKVDFNADLSCIVPQSLNAYNLNPKPNPLNPIKLVYVGSLSFQSTYLKELCEWVLLQNGKIQFDIYAYNLYDDVKEYLSGINSSWVNYYEEGIEYNDQPKVLAQYDVGLILYKAHNQNYTYNAPNKLFEYMACDLDVWYPDVLQGPKPYITATSYPKVVPVDFEDLENFDYTKAIDKEGLEYKPSEYFCEEVYKELVEALRS
ncbi:hypothetical protein [Saccharicrinis sp. GN24d3]|uniref:hypothetical protein n=1 Tax=Saccharicrinis sp. GN24d3 TaxID=3458416 RepID=UPI00403512FF